MNKGVFRDTEHCQMWQWFNALQWRELQCWTWKRDFVVSLNRAAYRHDFNSLWATAELSAAQTKDTKIARHGLVGLY